MRLEKVLLFSTILAVILFVLYRSPLTYLYCLTRESSWEKAKDRTELEARIYAPYTQMEIGPMDSMHGADHILLPSQKMIQYNLFHKEPLDVVYAADGKVVALYYSYE